jgi:hypothetical protein
MSEQGDFASKGQKWSGWARIIGTVIGLAALLGVGTFFYNEIWQSKVLTYTLLPTYHLGDKFFTGLIVENQGRVPLTGVDIVLSGLDAPMDFDPYIPSPHEPAQLVSGGAGQKEATIHMPRLSRGHSCPIYILTPNEVQLREGETFLVSSDQTPAVEVTERTRKQEVSIYVLALLAMLLGGLIAFFGWRDRRKGQREIEEVFNRLTKDLAEDGKLKIRRPTAKHD